MSSLKSLVLPESGIDEDEITRDATASIRGYIYQFDATIRAILQLGEDGSLIIEGVEDFDSFDDTDLTTHCQCKYYEAQRSTDSVIRDAIFPMLLHFSQLPPSKKTARQYVLYGHFKDKASGAGKLSSDDLKRIMKKEKKPDAKKGETEKKIIDLLIEHNIQDDDVRAFSERFGIRYCEKYDDHKNNITRGLQSALGVTLIEAQEYVYPTASTIISDIASCSDIEKRTISKKAFLEKIRPSSALYNIWHLREQGEEKFSKEMKRKYFSALNVESSDRFFAIDVHGIANIDLIYRALRHIIGNWSSHTIRLKKDKERYAPYVLFNGISLDDLTEIKGRLMGEGFCFKDGHPYFESPFNPIDLATPQTKENKIAVRLVKSLDEFQIAMASQQKQKEVCHFYLNTPLSPPSACRFVGIPIKSVSTIELIL